MSCHQDLLTDLVVERFVVKDNNALPLVLPSYSKQVLDYPKEIYWTIEKV